MFDPIVREVDETRYEFTQPLLVESTKAHDRLGIEPTALDDAVQQTVDWFRTQCG